MRGVRQVAITFAAVAATLALTGTADAAITKVRMSLSGTVTRQVHVIQHDYTCPGSTSPATGDVTESVSLTTYRPSTMVVIPGSAHALFIEPQTGRSNSSEIRTKGTITRSSTLGADGEVTCGEDPPSCGSRAFGLLSVVGGPDNGSNGRRFRGVELNGGLTAFRDPFSACKTPLPTLPVALHRTFALPARFMLSCRRGKMTRRVSATDSFAEPGTTDTRGTTTVKLSLTVSRLGPLRGYRC